VLTTQIRFYAEKSYEKLRRVPGLFSCFFLGWLVLCSFVVFRKTLQLPFAFDDISHLREVSLLWTRKLSLLQFLFLSRNEQTIPVLRSFFLASTFLSGLNAKLIRFLFLLIHILGAWFCSLLSLSTNSSKRGAFVAGTLYATAGGVAGSAVWYPAAAIFSISEVLFLLALLFLIYSQGKRKIFLLGCFLCLFLAGMTMNGSAFLSATLITYLLLFRPNLPIDKKWVGGALIIIALAVLLVAKWNLSRNLLPARFDKDALLRGAWLFYVAPLRFFGGWVPLDGLTVYGMKILSLLLWACLLLLALLLTKPEKKLLLALLAGLIPVTLLIGWGRTGFSKAEFFVTDRYFYYFLPFFCINIGFLAARLTAWITKRSRLIPALLLIAVPIILFGIHEARLRLEQTIPWKNEQFYGSAMSQMRFLLHLVRSTADARGPAKPIRLVDAGILFGGIDDNPLSLEPMFYDEYPHGLKGVSFTSHLAKSDEELENRIFETWADLSGIDLPIHIKDGIVIPVDSTSWIDFGKASYPHAVQSGFYGWDQVSRFMGSSGTVRLSPKSGDLVIRAHAPMSLIQKKLPSIRQICVAVSVDEVRIGDICLKDDQVQEFRIPMNTKMREQELLKPEVQVRLDSDFIWRPIDVDPTNLDERRLSIELMAIGFPPESQRQKP